MPKHDPDRIAELLAISDPIERAAAITAYGRPFGTLPPVLAKQRREDLETARARMTAGQIRIRIGLARSGIFRLTKAATS